MEPSEHNFLSSAFKRTHPTRLSSAIRAYIAGSYEQHPDSFAADSRHLDELRALAVAVQEPHVDGVQHLESYAAHLAWLEVKFPIDLGVKFTWGQDLGYGLVNPVSQDNLRFELANVVYNLAVLFNQLAVSTNRSSTDGLKAAIKYFCLAAGVVSHLKCRIIPDMRSTPPDDMDSMTLTCLENLYLAQAQECFWEKAIQDGLKDASVAKIAADASDLYFRACDFATKSNTVVSQWIHLMKAKHYHFAGAAQYRAARSSLEKQEYGEEIARLKQSLFHARSAVEESEYANRGSQSRFASLKARAEEDLRRAEKDNELIYAATIPPAVELRPLKRVRMVFANVPKEISEPLQILRDRSVLSKPIFFNLIPHSAHVAASVYVNHREQAIATIIDRSDMLTANMKEILRSMNLPGSLQALEKPLGLPSGVLAHAEEIRHLDGSRRLARSIEDIDKLRQAGRNTYQTGVTILRSELTEDASMRRKHGSKRWSHATPRLVAKQLYDQIFELETYLTTAEKSDALVRDKFAANKTLIRLLSSSNVKIEEHVPSSRHLRISTNKQREVSRLRATLDEVAHLQSRRKRRIDALRLKAKLDNVKPDLFAQTAQLEREKPMQVISPSHFESLFQERLHQYDDDRVSLEQDSSEQEIIVERLRVAHSNFATLFHGDESTKSRERCLQELEDAYNAYKDIVQNLEQGRRFYNDLSVIVGKFVEDCKTFAYTRRIEAARLEADLANTLPSPDLAITPSRRTSWGLEVESQVVKEHSGEQQSQQELQPPLIAPVPVKRSQISNMNPLERSNPIPSISAWTTSQPIRFDDASTSSTPSSSCRD